MPQFRSYIQILAYSVVAFALTLGARADEPACKATVVPGDGHADAMELILEIAWEGEPASWTILPPSLPIVEGLAWGEMRAIASSTESGTEIAYHTRITGEPGTYTVPSILIDGLKKDQDSDPLVISSNPVEISFAAPAAAPVFPLAGGIAVGLAVLTGVFLALNKGRATPQRSVAADAGEAIEETDLLAIASKRRIEGDTYGFYRALADAARSDAGLVERLQRCAEDAGFRGIEVTADQMDLDYRAVERLTANRDKENEV